MLNPTNPRDRATDWENDVIRRLHDHPELSQVIGERETPSGRSLYIARPTRIHPAACLECHSTPAAAPRTVLDKYGPANGFDWPLHETIGAQVVSVPMSLPLEQARSVWRTFMASFRGRVRVRAGRVEPDGAFSRHATVARASRAQRTKRASASSMPRNFQSAAATRSRRLRYRSIG